jgi:hypothetical protein
LKKLQKIEKIAKNCKNGLGRCSLFSINPQKALRFLIVFIEKLQKIAIFNQKSSIFNRKTNKNCNRIAIGLTIFNKKGLKLQFFNRFSIKKSINQSIGQSIQRRFLRLIAIELKSASKTLNRPQKNWRPEKRQKIRSNGHAKSAKN